MARIGRDASVRTPERDAMQDQETMPARPLVPDEPLSRRSLLRIGAVVGFGALFALTACGLGGGGEDEEDEDDD